MESSVMLGSISFLFYTTALRRFFAMAMHRAIGECRCGAVFGGDGDGNQNAMATAEGRLCNHSPRLACLPGVSRGIIIYRRRAVV